MANASLLWIIAFDQSQGSMMAMVTNMARIVVIVTAATFMSIFGGSLQSFLSADGTSSPPMAAGAMLLLYQFSMAMIVGFGPLFILCLIFDQTKELFRKWLMYGIGTLFSIAMLYVVTSIVLYLTLNLAGALWSATLINSVTGQGGEGYSSQAIQQGGIGLLMTVLIISVPPMAAMFFNGTPGNFLPYAALGAGAASRPGPQGQPAGSYGGYGGYGGGMRRRRIRRKPILAPKATGEV